MSRTMMLFTCLSLALSPVLCGNCNAARKTSASVPTKVSKAEKSNATKPNRLPRYFGQLELDDQQRSEVLKIQAQYQQQLSELQQRMEELQLQLNKDLAQVLSRDQRKTLKQLVEKPRRKSKQ